MSVRDAADTSEPSADVTNGPSESSADPNSSPSRIGRGAEERGGVGSDPPVDMETALQWLQQLKPNLAIALLKQPELALQATRAFLGFRFNAQGYQNPVVRRRLAEEIVREPKLQEVFRAVIEMEDKAAADPLTAGAPLDSRPSRIGRGAEERGGVGPNALVDNLKDQLRAEREQRKRDRADSRATVDEVKKANADIERRLAEQSTTLADTLAENDSLRQALAKAQQRIAKLDRQNTRMKIEVDLMAKAAGKSRPAPQAPTAEPPSTPPDHRSPFEAAAYRLVSQENLEAALALAEATLIEEPGNAGALRIAADVYMKTGKRDRAAQAARDLTIAYLGAADLRAATESLFLLLTADPMSGLIATVSKPYVQALKSAENADLQELRSAYGRFAAAQPAVFKRLSRLIDEYVPADIARILTRPSTTGPSEPLPLQMPTPMTATDIVDAVDRSDEAVVDKLRVALSQLRSASPDDYGRVISAIADVAGDESYLKPLIGKTRGPAIVDASNVAWHDDERGMADRPRLHQVLKVRAAMRQRGYFPILLIGDAPLPYTVDDREACARMMTSGELTLSTTGTDADETILREAKRLGATVVSNDYMADWDPDNEVKKLRYVIQSGGPAYLLG